MGAQPVDQPVGPSAAEPASWLDTELPAMRPGIEIIEGINHELVAFDPETGHYTRLSRSGAAILRALNGKMTGRQFAASAARPRAGSASAGRTEHIVLSFLGELRAAGLLTVPPSSGRQQAAVRFARRGHMPRRALVTAGASTLLDPLARALRRAPRLLAALWATGALLSLYAAWSVISAPGAAQQLRPSQLTWGWAVLVGTLLVQTAVHELSHALACRCYGVPVREIGIGLLFYVVPAAYVDRTDSYRLTGRRARVLIALAGVAVDAVWLGGHALLAHAGGQTGRTFALMVWLQIALLIGNLNPLLPTDGYHALEAGMGAVNLRARAFTALRFLVLRQPPPSWLATRGRVQRVRYLVFGAVCLAYAALVAAGLLHSLLLVAQGAG